MKSILIAVAVVGVALLAFNYFTTGEVKLVPSFAKSEDEVALDGLRARFDAAQTQFAQAYRTAGVAGVDTTADVEAAVRSVRQIDKDVAAFLKRPTAEGTKQKAEDLARAVGAFLADVR